ncbi:hypothetical protein Pcac1_g15935 [Phytophthora cactorum]|nr:hypothetical protein Pcac1_g15935 [Phytophthora cactorum]
MARSTSSTATRTAPLLWSWAFFASSERRHDGPVDGLGARRDGSCHAGRTDDDEPVRISPNVRDPCGSQIRLLTIVFYRLFAVARTLNQVNANAVRTYNYPGSLTTPGCDEIVDWWVVQQPMSISSADFTRLQTQLKELHVTDNGNNARPVLPLNGRTVVSLQ